MRGDVDAAINLGLTVPWAPVEYPVAVKVLKTALEQGANFWNGVSSTLGNRKEEVMFMNFLTPTVPAGMLSRKHPVRPN